jgi:hypothetical protein
MQFFLILIGLLIIINRVETSLHQRKQNKNQVPPPQQPPYGFDNTHYQGSQPYGYAPFLEKKPSKEEEDANRRKRQSQQGIFYTLLFLLGLMAILMYWNH